MKKRLVWILIVAVIAFAGVTVGQETEDSVDPIVFEQPVLIASIGQSAGAQQARILAMKAGLDFTFEQRPTVDMLDGNATLIVVLGASSKGLGAAGVDMDGEIAWGIELITRARELEMEIIAMHIEGGARRGPSSDLATTTFALLADHIVVKGGDPEVEWTEAEEANGNADGLFTTIATENEITITYIARTLDAVEVLQQLFVVETSD